MTVNCILERVAETRSTNDDLLERWRAGSLIDPVARIAYKQTAGKGRAGRTWLANPEDTICFSLAFPFHQSPAELSGLSLLVGLAVISGLAQACNLSEATFFDAGLRLKWPNDLLLNNAKLGGILIEGGQAKSGDPTWMIVGIGINLRNAKEIEVGLGQKIGSLDQLLPSSITPPDMEYVWIKLLESLQGYFKQFAQSGFGSFHSQWSRWDAYAGQVVCISGAGKNSIIGTAKGVDANGALLLENEHETICVYAGDVSLRAKP
ncbi:biotin--[acetyl-CoA-carboxylase] ligase [Polynucleobacter asymbioticus]|uniref:biotin--[acetyl-CoA-carboxylase] ligase n=1 Tax=Polynucleobacter asymbioticus TaxID=576611 RepID=UPI0008F8005F|nr:biotin--[acetyl-CoA-carboxylase] ligase [Polynucleobacter asymbioticus]